MRRISFGKFSLILAGAALLLFVLHFANIMLMLNTVFAPLISLFGVLLGVMGYFERDKQRKHALIGMIVNSGFLICWIILLILAISKVPQ